MSKSSSRKAPSLEDCLSRIDAALSALESGELPLEDAFKRYEAALALVKQASEQLDGYQARLEELRGTAPAPVADADDDADDAEDDDDADDAEDADGAPTGLSP